jgi:two-component system, sensor histidine kinase SagS
LEAHVTTPDEGTKGQHPRQGSRGERRTWGDAQDSPPSLAGVPALLLLDAIGEGVALADRAGAILWANELIHKQSGAMKERLAGACRQFDRDFPMPPPGVGTPALVQAASFELGLAQGDRYYNLLIHPVTADMARGGVSPATLVLVVRDASAAHRLKHKIDAIDQAGGELVRIDPDVVRKHNAHERLKLLETKIVNVARNLLHFDHFAIRLLDDRSGRLELVIGYDLPPSFDSFVIRPALEGYGISGYVAASGRSYLCGDITADPLYLPGVEGARSSLTVPLRLHDKVIGIMNVESEKPSAFTDEDRQLGEIFARYIALAVHMLDILVVERCETNIDVSGRVATELKEPLEDIAHEVDLLRRQVGPADASSASHLDRIKTDLAAIRQRLIECTSGPTSLLGVERALQEHGIDPLIVGKRILVADDEQRIRKTIGDVLSMRGAEVTVCATGAEAIRTLAATPDAFDLVLSDIRMPDHNGYEVFSAARRHSPRAPVILMTGFGYDPHHSIVRASQDGLQVVLFKPFQVERLLEDVRRALTGRKP